MEKSFEWFGVFREGLNFPNQIDDVIKEINNWLQKIN